jgi:hypothetical protein
MSITVFLAICILGCDFLLYVLFQWIYGEKHRKHARRVAARAKKRRALSTPTLSSTAAEAASVVPFPERAMQYRTGYF